MITKYQVRKHLEQYQTNPDFTFRVEGENIVDKKTNGVICSLDHYVDVLRTKAHCNFEVIYYERVSLLTVYRCKDCGTVIFGGDDEFRYDPNLSCPTCGGYETRLQYWTADEIASDPLKQKDIESYEYFTKLDMEADERFKKRGGLYDWQVWKKKIYTKNHLYTFDLECDNICHSKLKGLKLKIGYFIKDKDDSFFEREKSFQIPLSKGAFYYQFIYPHSKRCPEELRARFFWEKKEKECA
jgi:DNA-directed RNA polymerase subunit RPC12/RpoP